METEMNTIESNSPELEVRGKTYIYVTKTGKEKKIHREWKVSTAKKQRNQEINDYFNDNIERIQGMKNIRQVMRDYNDSHDTKASYNIIYKKYNSIFNTRKPRTKNVEEQPITIVEQEDKHEDKSA